jgi:lysophospholipase L1-like esterase
MRRRHFITGAAALAAYARLPRAKAQASGHGDSRLPEGFYNFTGSNLSNWAAALAAQQRGSADAIIGCLGDSTVAGHGAAGNDLASNAKSLSWPTQLAKLIPGGSWSSVWGDNNVTAAGGNLYDFDVRLSGSGWTIEAMASGTLCGGLLREHPGHPDKSALSFEPADQFDRIEIWHAQLPESGHFLVDVDGGPTLAAVNCAGPDALVKTTTSCALGTHKINLRRSPSSAKDVYLTALRTYNSAVKEISVYNLGGSMLASADFTINRHPWNILPALAAISPHLVIFEAGIVNDWNGAAPLATVASNMTAVIDVLKSVNCDVILMSGVPSEPPPYASSEAQEKYVANMKQLAYAANVPLIDIWELFGGTRNPGAMFDSLHPNHAGCGLIAGYAKLAVLNPAARSPG